MAATTVAPSYPRDYEFHHLAVRFPFIGSESDSSRFPVNTEHLAYYRNTIESDQLWMVRRLGWSAWLCKGTPPQSNAPTTDLLVSKRAVAADPEQGDDISGAPILDERAVPGFLRFSTLQDPGLRSWSKGQYLSRTLSYFPSLKAFSYHKVEFDPYRRERIKSPHLVFSGIYKYYNGGSLEQLMQERDTIFRAFSWNDSDNHWWTAYRLPECLIWHIISEIGQAMIKLHTGEPRSDEEDKVNGLQRLHSWRPIIHSRITPRNVWFHFDEAALESEDEETRLRACCFPQVILGDFFLADFEDLHGPDTPDRVGENYYRQWKDELVEADNAEFSVKRGWWDRWFFGLLIRKMLLFGDTGIINKSETPVPPSGVREEGIDIRKKFPDYLEEESIGMVKFSTVRYWKENMPDPATLDNSHAWFGNHGFREWSRELRQIAWNFERGIMNGETNRGVTPPGRHFVDDDIRTTIPDMNSIRRYVETAKTKVAEFKAIPVKQLIEETRTECLVANEDFGPRYEIDDTMLYRPKRALASKFAGVRIWNSQDAVKSDMAPFFGPWSYLFVSYNPDDIMMDQRIPIPPRPEDLSNKVLSFGFIPYMGEQNPDPSKNDGDPYGDPLGKTIAEKHRREHRERWLREEAKRQRQNKANEEGRPEGQGDKLTVEERRRAAWALFKAEEDEAQLRRKQVAFETRGDTLLEAWNSVVLLGLGSTPGNENRGFWERWREGSADSFEITNTP